MAPTPDLGKVRRQLLFEFPYAESVIDFALSDLIGRDRVQLQPLLLFGKPGSGKSCFARRLAETLGVGAWRTDAAQSDGGVFGGTAKRWYSAEPAHPFLAISRAKQANPIVIIDEIEKAGTRSDCGRFWDVLLGMLEPETSRRYPDPGLQIEVDLSHVSYVATGNDPTPLPPALRDRFRVVEFPEPRAADIDSLLPSLLVDICRERGLDARWTQSLTGWERDVVAARWKGGSVRRLRRFVETVVRARERDAIRQ
jgi:ATP-dependent Lon protease